MQCELFYLCIYYFLVLLHTKTCETINISFFQMIPFSRYHIENRGGELIYREGWIFHAKLWKMCFPRQTSPSSYRRWRREAPRVRRVWGTASKLWRSKWVPFKCLPKAPHAVTCKRSGIFRWTQPCVFTISNRRQRKALISNRGIMLVLSVRTLQCVGSWILA